MTTANTRVAQILLKRGNTTQSGSYVGPLGEVTLDTDLDTLRIHDGSTPGGYSMLATKSDINQVNSDIGNISLGVVDTAPIIANVQAAVNSTINANVTAANAAIARLDANLGTATTNIAGLLSNAATQEGHITSLTASVVTLSTGISAMTANAAAQEVHINLLNANVTAANAAIASLQSQVYADANVAEYLLGTITTGNIIPQGNVIYTLGNASHQWRSLYLSSNTLFIGGQTLSVSDGQLSLNGNSIGGASTGHIGFEDNQIVNTNSIDESIVIMPGGMGYSAGETYIRLPGNADAATQPITIRNMIGNVAIGVASSATWLFNVEDQSLSLPHGWGENVSGSAKLSAPNGSITLTSSHGSDTNSFVFGANGNLTLPTIWDFTSSPAVQSSGIIFGDGTLQTTAYTGDNTEQGDPIALVDNVGQMPKAGSLWYNTDDGRLYVADGSLWIDANPQTIPSNMVEYESDDSIELRGNLVFSDTTEQTTAFNLNPGTTAPLAGVWYNTDDGRLYSKIGNVWVDTNPAVIPENAVLYTNGNIVLPDDGYVTWANGTSILNGITGSNPDALAYNDDGDVVLRNGAVIRNSSGTDILDTINIPAPTQVAGNSYDNPNMVVPVANDVNWALGGYSAGQEFWMQAKFFGLNGGNGATGQRGFRVYDAGNDKIQFKVDDTGLVTLAGNIKFADGTIQSTAGGASYGNTQVAAYLTAGSFATTTDITAAIDDLIGFAPGALDTLGEIAANLANGASAVSSITSSIASTNANVTAANAAIATLQGQVYSNTNVASYLTGSITTGNILPAANVTYNLGSATQQWKSLYVSSNTIYLGGVPLSVSGSNLTVNGSAISASTGAVTFERNKIKGGGVNQVGHRFSIATNKDGQTSLNSNGISLAYSNNANLIASGWTVQFANGGSSSILWSTGNPGYVSMQIPSAVAYTFPLTFISPDYIAGEESILELTPDEAIPASTWSFYGNGNVRFPDGTTQTTAYTGVSSYGNTQVAAYLVANPQPGTYSNTNVSSYLPTYSGNVGAGNIVTTGATSGNISGANYISANVFQVSNGIFWSNGTAWSSTSGGGTNYTNANVSSFLASFGSNSISTTGNITASNVSITNTYTVANIQTTGTYGNITGANVISANSVTVTTFVRTQPVAFAALPTASSAGTGARAFITDANTFSFASAVAGGGSYYVPVFSNGTNWFVG